jgi:hypothetical protein
MHKVSLASKLHALNFIVCGILECAHLIILLHSTCAHYTMEGASKNYIKHLTNLSTFAFTFTIGFDQGVLQREFTTMQKKNLVVRATDYQLIAGQLYKIGVDNILRRCVIEHERHIILAKAHEGIVGGHYTGKLSCRKYCTQGYGGQEFIRIQRNIVKSVMFVKELGIYIGRMRFH